MTSKIRKTYVAARLQIVHNGLMKGGVMENRTRVVTRLRVLTIKPSDVKIASYRVEMKLAEPRVVPAPYVHHARKR